jgi:hypothetical protein
VPELEAIDQQLPFVSMGVFCEKALKEADGMLSLIRIVDQVNVPSPPPPLPAREGMPPPPPPYPISNLFFILRLMGGSACGTQQIVIVMSRPDGTETARKVLDLTFTDENYLHTSIINISIANTTQEGTMLLSVFASEVNIANVPLKVKYLPFQSLQQRVP